MKSQRNIQKNSRTGRYYVQIRRNGIRRYFDLGTGLKAARRNLNEVERKIASGQIQFVTAVTSAITDHGKRDIQVAELAVRHLAWVKENRAQGTFKLRQHYIFTFLEFLKLGQMRGGRFEIEGSMLVSEVTRSTVTDFQLWSRKNGKGGPNAGNQSLRHVKTMLRWGEEEELCHLSFRRFPTIREIPPETKRVQFDELAKLLTKAPEDFVDIVKFGLLTGLRPEELRELRPEQIIKTDSDVWYVRIERHKTAGRTGEKTVRTVPLSNEARQIFTRQMKNHQKAAYVFLNADGKPYTRTVFRNRLIRWCRRARITEITPYALRHTFASVESDAHVESTALARLMGHSTVRTLARYISNSHEHDVKAVEAAQSALHNALAARHEK